MAGPLRLRGVGRVQPKPAHPARAAGTLAEKQARRKTKFGCFVPAGRAGEGETDRVRPGAQSPVSASIASTARRNEPASSITRSASPRGAAHASQSASSRSG